jgi:putative FmdB family regulatory protein
MPTYEFACPHGHEFTRFYRKISDGVATLPCPECGEVATRQISAGAGLVFKGSGFYITDYGKDGKKGVSPAKPSEHGSGGAKSGDSTNGAASGSATATPTGTSDGSSGGSSAATPAGGSSGGAAKKKGSSSE